MFQKKIKVLNNSVIVEIVIDDRCSFDQFVDEIFLGKLLWNKKKVWFFSLFSTLELFFLRTKSNNFFFVTKQNNIIIFLYSTIKFVTLVRHLVVVIKVIFKTRKKYRKFIIIIIIIIRNLFLALNLIFIHSKTNKQTL